MLHYYVTFTLTGDYMSDSFIASFVPAASINIAKLHTAIVSKKSAIIEYIKYRREVIPHYSIKEFIAEVIHAAS